MTYYIDSSYFLNFFINDNKEQAQKVRDLFLKGIKGEKKLVSSSLVFLEVYKSLNLFSSFSKIQIIKTLEVILQMDFIEFNKKEVIFKAMEIYSNNNLALDNCFHLAYLFESDDRTNPISLATFNKNLTNLPQP